MYRLIAAYERGDLEPVDVELGEMPSYAGHAMQAAAADIALLIGLRLAVDEGRPLPYATSFAAERLGLVDKGHASRALRSLVKAGVVLYVGRLPRRPNGPREGTKLYAALSGIPEGASGVKGAAEHVG
jgi:hypothetical protein